jgi:hypothetical protein
VHATYVAPSEQKTPFHSRTELEKFFSVSLSSAVLKGKGIIIVFELKNNTLLEINIHLFSPQTSFVSVKI